MDSWCRKHCDAMATACHVLQDRNRLTPDNRDALKSIRSISRSLAKGNCIESFGGHQPKETIEMLVEKLCAVCKTTGDFNCPGRRGWLDRCQLVAGLYDATTRH